MSRAAGSGRALRRVWRVAAAALVALLVIAAAVVPRAATALVMSVPGPPPDAIVSLASHEWERLPAAVAQAAAYPDALVVLTVPEEVTVHNCHDCAHRPERLIAAGVHASRIRQVPLTADGTYGEARALKQFMQESNLRHLMVVTSPYHTRRSLATFRQVFAGSPMTIAVVPAEATSPAHPDWWWWAAPYDRAYVGYEWAAITYYRLKYGVPIADLGKALGRS